MKNQERSDTIKKFLVIILLLILSINSVYATEYSEITSDTEIRYKWYKEVQVGNYYPLKDIISEDKIDKTKIILGDYSVWKDKYCNLSSTYYEVSKRIMYKYKKVESIRYILLENFNYDNNIKIYHEAKEIDFKIINNEENTIKIDLKQSFLAEKLLFYIVNAEDYKIGLYAYENFEKEVISKKIENETIIIPDKDWIHKNSSFVEEYTSKEYQDSDLTTRLKKYYECRYREKYVYKYEIEREYYDDNYYLNLEGYIKDTSDYKVYYKGEPITNIIEITKEKIIKEPQIEYIYIKNGEQQIDGTNDNKIQETDSSKEKKCEPEIKKEVVEKEILKIPKVTYIVILILITIIIFLNIKLYKKYVV